MASSRTVTTLAVRTLRKATAFLIVSTTDPQGDCKSFAANTDGAEKGIPGIVKELDTMKRASKGQDRSVQLPPASDTGQVDRASSTGASRYAGTQPFADDPTQPGKDGNDIVNNLDSSKPISCAMLMFI
jgi:hypothetical protein